jgi:inositol phosphorylceramide mannosyltransferase catalytic subunit
LIFIFAGKGNVTIHGLIKNAVLSGLNKRNRADLLPSVASGSTIPKIIHQTYSSKVLPPAIEENINHIRQMNPGWEYRFYDDADAAAFIAENYGVHILGYYERINSNYGAARADLFRYLLIYKTGGVYLDIKSSLQRNLDTVIRKDDTFILCNWNIKPEENHYGGGQHFELRHIQAGEYQQWHIAAAPGHPFLRAVIGNVLANIDAYNPGLHGVGKHGVVRLTGPIAYTLAISPLLRLYPHRFAHSGEDLGFKYSIYAGKGKHDHKVLFQPHYSALDESIINLGYGRRTVALLLNTVRGWYKLLSGHAYEGFRNKQVP